MIGQQLADDCQSIYPFDCPLGGSVKLLGVSKAEEA